VEEVNPYVLARLESAPVAAARRTHPLSRLVGLANVVVLRIGD